MLFAIVLLIADPDSNFSQKKSQSIQSRQKELEKLNKSIKDTRSQINKLDKKERSTVKELHINQKHSLELNKYILLLDEQLTALQNEIKVHDSIYFALSEELRKMISSYAAFAKKLYLKGRLSDEDVLFTTASYDDEIVNDIYAAKITEFIKKKMQSINLMRVAVSNESGLLKDKNDYQTELRANKNRENNYLKFSIKKNERLLGKIKSDSKQLKVQLQQKQNSANKLKSIIAELIRKEAEKDKTAGTPQNYKTLGIYPWPTASKSILRDFGQIKNKETNTVFDNPGIDIKTSNGSIVKSVDVGEVSMINWLPGYGTIVIINHGGGFRSVYANMSTVNIKKGDRVQKGTIIGKSGQSVDGEFLHFEIWRGNSRLNPRKYLK